MATGWCFAVPLGGSGRLAVVLRLSSRVGLVGGSRLAGASRFLGGRVDSQSLAVTPSGLRQLAAASRGLRWVGAILRLVSWVPWGDS